MTRALLITNPAAARADERHLLAARARLVAGGWAVEIGRTGGPGDGERLARAAVADGVDVLIAHGGDGTAMDVAAAVVYLAGSGAGYVTGQVLRVNGGLLM